MFFRLAMKPTCRAIAQNSVTRAASRACRCNDRLARPNAYSAGIALRQNLLHISNLRLPGGLHSLQLLNLRGQLRHGRSPSAGVRQGAERRDRAADHRLAVEDTASILWAIGSPSQSSETS